MNSNVHKHLIKTGARAYLKSIEKITRQSKIFKLSIKRTHSVENQAEFIQHKKRGTQGKNNNEQNVARLCACT